MKGVILAGGMGSRLFPITEVTNKHLLPVYDRPMIFHPLDTLLRAGIDDIMIVSGTEHAGAFLRLLKSGEQFGARFTFRVQQGNGGIAEALSLAEDFVGDDDVAVILGDNIFEDDFAEAVQSFEKGARIFLKEVHDAQRFGVAEVNENKVVKIEEKPSEPKSNYAVTGFYLYDSRVFEIIKKLEPSWRNELEITDVSNHYINWGEMDAVFLEGRWTDAGTFESLHRANTIARDKIMKQMEQHKRDRVMQGIEHHYDDKKELYPQYVPFNG